ncbi:MAG: hypothetical protein C4522_19785 [Desulfobacteraceae bacterium]|nr:MAG: hypothetical protein C4522_19785 [Desulfobacteraceae bacterium]
MLHILRPEIFQSGKDGNGDGMQSFLKSIHLETREKDAFVVHALFSLICILMIVAPVNVRTGIRLFVLVIVYDLILVFVGWFRKDRDWLQLWIFVSILSLFQVFPDWFLSAQLKILVFPEDGLFKIGTVSGYMMGLWTIPLFIIVFVGEQMEKRFSSGKAALGVGFLSLIMFGGSEQTLWMLESWYARNVTMVGHVAIYILIPEIILGLATWYGYKMVKSRNVLYKTIAAFGIMQLYLGSAAYFYFVLETLVRS